MFQIFCKEQGTKILFYLLEVSYGVFKMYSGHGITLSCPAGVAGKQDRLSQYGGHMSLEFESPY